MSEGLASGWNLARSTPSEASPTSSSVSYYCDQVHASRKGWGVVKAAEREDLTCL